ncbi:MAG: hypothetical protein CMM02_01610 [Rhodopirellula sp.]|nr:hypothetical protein [Rhodopirellula sp.]|tara:strand:- start:1944 stop:4592 length:2649 start_codon:yes stop_codon:yes gene_type:complete
MRSWLIQNWLILLLCLLNVEASARQPNVIFILADDLGYSELGCYGNDFNETPSLDKLSKQGMRFTDAYAAAPVCSPYRASLMTGLHPARVGIIDYLRPNSAFAISPAQYTLPRAFQANGYTTGFIGKWHLTGYKYHDSEFEVRPTDVGFDTEIGGEIKGVGNGANFWPYVFRDQPVRWLDFKENKLGNKEYLVDRMNQEAVEFIERNKEKPFFLYLSHYSTHSILNGRADKVKKYIAKHPPGPSSRERCYLCQDSGHEGDALHHWAQHHNPHLAAMLESIDDGVGLIMDKLEELELSNDTILIFSSDNGGEVHVTSNAPLRGGKSQLYEGGIRVPLIIRWPGQVPIGATTHSYTTSTDFFPTLAEACKLKTQDNYKFDGTSVLGDWRGTKQRPAVRDLHWHYPLEKPHFLGGVSAGAIRSGDWKLVEFFETGELELYNLETDLSETKNVARQHPQLVENLYTRLVQWRDRVDARTSSSLKMTRSGNAIFQDAFSPELVSDRWSRTENYTIKEGTLVRTDHYDKEARIFLQKPEYKNVVVKFDFQFQGTKDIRFLTGTPGKYNVVVHIHRDRFFLQTAVDQTVPFFPAIHGICAFDFEEDKWYTMTVEIADDEVLAHIDQQHFVHAQHPIIDRTRTYFAFQTATPGAVLDNVQLLHGSKLKDWEKLRAEYIKRQQQRPLPEMSIRDKWQMLKINTHDLLYRTDPQYKSIVDQLAVAKLQQHEQFPEVFSSIKDVRKPLTELRKKLAAENMQYQALNKQINQTRQRQKRFVLERFVELEKLPASEFEAAYAQRRQQAMQDADFIELQKQQAAAEAKLTEAFPELFITNEEIQAKQREQRVKLKDTPEFQQMLRHVSDLVKTEMEYRHQKNAELKALWLQIFTKK